MSRVDELKSVISEFGGANKVYPCRRLVDVSTNDVIGYTYANGECQVALSVNTIKELGLQDSTIVSMLELPVTKMVIDSTTGNLFNCDMASDFMEEYVEDGIVRSAHTVMIDGYVFGKYQYVSLDNAEAFARTLRGDENYGD